MKSPAIVFTAHNIALDDGTFTRPNSPVTADEPITGAVMRSLNLFFPPSERKGKTIVDLGCLEGGYTVEFARAGFEATGLEAREQNIERPAGGTELRQAHHGRDPPKSGARADRTSSAAHPSFQFRRGRLVGRPPFSAFSPLRCHRQMPGPRGG